MLYKKTPFRYAEVVQAQRKLTRKGVFMGTRAQSLAHTKWLCKYHIVFAPKYRRKIIFSQLRESIREILRDLCKYKGGGYFGRASHAGSCSSTGEYPTKDKCIKFYGVPERQKLLDDL